MLPSIFPLSKTTIKPYLMFHCSRKVCSGVLHSVLCITAANRTVATLFTACENAPNTFCYCFTGTLREPHCGNLWYIVSSIHGDAGRCNAWHTLNIFVFRRAVYIVNYSSGPARCCSVLFNLHCVAWIFG
jgi:hypothetical protein